MKRIFYASLGLMAWIGCNRTGPAKDSFTLQGHISGMDSGRILLTHRVSGNSINDTLNLDHGDFSYSGTVSEPTVYYLSVSDTTEPLMFFADAHPIRITGTRDSIASARVAGSTAQDSYLDFEKQMKPFHDQMDTLDQAYVAAEKDGTIKAKEDSLNNIYDSINKEEQNSIVSYVKANPSSVIGAWAVTRNFLYEPDADLLSTLFQSMDSSVKQTSYGKLIDTTMVIARKLQVGKIAPDFTQNDPDGKPISLSSLRGKYVLVDFWASWCGPCRAENPNVVKAFNQYKNKGFTILGVSLDEKKDPWLKAIQDDHLDWYQVSDLKFWNNQVAKEYGIRAIPSNFLLDKDGKILGRNLRGNKLDLALAGIFK